MKFQLLRVLKCETNLFLFETFIIVLFKIHIIYLMKKYLFRNYFYFIFDVFGIINGETYCWNFCLASYFCQLKFKILLGRSNYLSGLNVYVACVNYNVFVWKLFSYNQEMYVLFIQILFNR